MPCIHLLEESCLHCGIALLCSSSPCCHPTLLSPHLPTPCLPDPAGCCRSGSKHVCAVDQTAMGRLAQRHQQVCSAHLPRPAVLLHSIPGRVCACLQLFMASKNYQPQSKRMLYISWRAAVVSGGLVAHIILAANWTHFAVSFAGGLLQQRFLPHCFGSMHERLAAAQAVVAQGRYIVYTVCANCVQTCSAHKL